MKEQENNLEERQVEDEREKKNSKKMDEEG
jgi:hypothetical protein